MEAYRLVFDSRHLQADCSGTQCLAVEYGKLYLFTDILINVFNLRLTEQHSKYTRPAYKHSLRCPLNILSCRMLADYG